VKTTVTGRVLADDDDFCSIYLVVKQSDSEAERRIVDVDTPDGSQSYAVNEPIRVRVEWEQNCTSRPGLWLTPAEATTLAELLRRASGTGPPRKRRATRLSVDQVRAIDQFAELLFVMFPHMLGVVHCGSSITSDEWRDVDVRIVMENNQVHVLRAIVELDDLHMLLSRWGQQVTGLPIDCQVQERTEHERLSYADDGAARGRWRGAGSLGTNARRIRDAGWFDADESEAEHFDQGRAT
jgi:hypothetical protein